jgi:hypothetical protein
MLPHEALAVRKLKFTPFRLAGSNNIWIQSLVIRIYIDVVNISTVPQPLKVELKNVDIYASTQFDNQPKGLASLPDWLENASYPNVRNIVGYDIPGLESTTSTIIGPGASGQVYFSISCHLKSSTSTNFNCKINDEPFLAGLPTVDDAKSVGATAKFELEAEVNEDRGALLVNVQTEFLGSPSTLTTREANGGRAF